jgi:hypothetical protein
VDSGVRWNYEQGINRLKLADLAMELECGSRVVPAGRRLLSPVKRQAIQLRYWLGSTCITVDYTRIILP